MNTPLRIGVLGAGWHSCSAHLPSLSHYHSRHPGRITLAALCDLDPMRTADAAGRFGFERTYVSLDAMLGEARLDACIAVTPIAETSRAIRRILAAHLPVVMEKPLAATLSDARALVAEISANQAPVMVSMNRRFCPVIAESLRWLADRNVQYLRATMARHSRTEHDFLESTGVHLIDSLRAIQGDIAECRAEARSSGQTTAWRLRLVFVGGVVGDVDILPNAGHSQERYDFFGPDFHLSAHSAGTDDGRLAAWEKGQLLHESQPAEAMPGFVADGTYAETCAFIESLINGKVLYPSPSVVLPSMELCHRIVTGDQS